MDEKFTFFENWYLSRVASWKERGVFVDKSGLGQYGHQYRIELHSKKGEGNIVLYESNGYYWVDFECYNEAYSTVDTIYIKGNIELKDIDETEQEFVEYLVK